MDWTLTEVLAALVAPPGLVVTLLAAALALLPLRPRTARVLLAGSLAALYLFSSPFVADGLLRLLEPAPADPLADSSGQAIVVPGAGLYFAAPEYGGDTLNSASLERARYAAHLHRASGRPILVTGGVRRGATPEALLLHSVLTREFAVPVRWVERDSPDTLANARLSRRLLREAGVDRIYLVTHAWHMRRAKLAFESAGFTVIPAPTGFATRDELTALDFVPRARALRDSSRFVHELVGLAWYHLRIAIGR